MSRKTFLTIFLTLIAVVACSSLASRSIHGQEKPVLPFINARTDVIIVMRPAMIVKSMDYQELQKQSGEYFEK